MAADLSRCPSPGVLEALLAERLSGPERDGAETHVEGCTACQERLARLASGTFRLILSFSAIPGESTLGPDEGFLRRLGEMPPPIAVSGGEARRFPSDEQ